MIIMGQSNLLYKASVWCLVVSTLILAWVKGANSCVNELMLYFSIVTHMYLLSSTPKCVAFNINYETENPNVICKFYSKNAVKLNFQ